VFDEDVVEQVFYRKETTVFDEDVVEQVFYRKETTVFYRIETTVFEYDLGGIMTLGVPLAKPYTICKYRRTVI